MGSRWELVETAAGFHVRFIASNGEIVLTSEVYTRAEAAEDAISLVSTQALGSAVTYVNEVE